ncbi:Peptidase_C39 like family protein [Amycolatopsis arida]|uniref:Peptidase_C39 like family protein n=1 Tax=Amycolatopsis arida TaxID=587909 RepID=A0A1I5QGI4_9PSEU|nr:peptidase C39 family protein [Amycolatopsis arida]TDX98834.1 peptidase C39-like protein [Amycolatopsis arida]SFP45352.1 Peptidase_C39 like family protein [Amycolatopsis arida]
MRGRLITTAVVAALATVAVVVPTASADPSGGEEAIDYQEWTWPRDFARGTPEGVSVGSRGLRLVRPIGTVERTEPTLGTTRTYEYATWTSPEYRHGFGATELVASWNARTPERTWLQVETRGRTEAGAETAWYVLGQWAHGDEDIRRTTVAGQRDEHASVSVDTLVTRPGVALRSYQVRVTLYREAGSRVTPTVRSVGAMVSAVPDRFTVPISPPGRARGIELPVPRHAQNLHKGQYPEYGGGGQNWCSPTSTQMVVEYWGRGPSREELSWLPADYVDPTVAHAARHTYDYSYRGTGNWPFNTAYAARYGLRGHITRLHSLAELEEYIARGIPVITSQSFLSSELDGAGYGTAGHIMVVVGFTENGDVIVNDPASNTNEGVRNVYPRAQFETIWQRTKRYDANGKVASGPGGIVYLIRP